MNVLAIFDVFLVIQMSKKSDGHDSDDYNGDQSPLQEMQNNGRHKRASWTFWPFLTVLVIQVSKKSDGQDSDDYDGDQLPLDEMQKNGQHKRASL